MCRCQPAALHTSYFIQHHPRGIHTKLDVQFREDDGCICHAPAVMAILRRVALNMVKTARQQSGADLSIGLPSSKIGRNP